MRKLPRQTVLPWILAVILLMLTQNSHGAVRRYFLAARDVIWDYATQGKNLADPKHQASADFYLKRSLDRIGHAYKKSSYFQFTDDTYSKEVYKRPLLGILGPILHAEVGDTLEITYFNNASHTFSIHPHGLFYRKDAEGMFLRDFQYYCAVYLDGTSGRFKDDEIVLPGQRVTLTWNVTDSDAPGDGDPTCLPWIYHSHVDTVRDTSSGVTGLLITCRKGVLDADNLRTDVDVEMPIFVKNYDENLSWHLDENIKTYCLNPVLCRSLRDNDDEDFTKSNYMKSINGYMYGHLPELEACVGHKVALYIIGLGNEFDVHSIHFHGQILKYQHTKGDTVSVYSATFVAAEMIPREVGYWHVTDMVGTNEQDGVSAFLFTKKCAGVTAPTDTLTGTTRDYILSADEITWDYGPGGKDRLTGLPLTTNGSHSKIQFEKSDTRIGGIYTKAVFRQYTDLTFTALMTRLKDEEHMGLLGPLLQAEVGDALLVTLRNAARYPISLLAHGLTYNFQEEGTVNGGNPAIVPGGYIQPGKIHTYVFRVPDDFLLNVTEPCLNFMYTSGLDPSKDHNSGLVGPILICKKGYHNIAAKPKEFFLLLSTFDENLSLYADDNIQAANLSTALDKTDPEFQQSNLMFSINGYSFGNIPGLSMCLGESVSWYVMSMGSDRDVHTVTFDGNPFSEKGKHRDGRHLVPGSTAALGMAADNIGVWEVMSHSTLARDGGMFGFYEVTDCGHGDVHDTVDSQITMVPGGAVREFFIAAEEVEWNYAPLERSIITGQDLNDPRTDGHIFIRDDDYFIGTVYQKAVFRGYTDATFTSKILGVHENILGPALRAEVGDLVKVTFLNRASQLYSIHSRGVRTSQSDSGTNYGRAVAALPGMAHVYHWQIPDSAGPGPSDPNCIPWLYYSAVDPTKDVNSGLVGTLIICRRGILDNSGYRQDVDEELFVLMSVMNENLSWYLDRNIHKFARARVGTDYKNDEHFEESNLMHAVNGRVYGNNPGLYVEFGTKVTWYLMSLGAEVDLHSFHLHGHTFVHTSDRHREDVLQLFPGQAEAVEMVADNPGTWLLHCHVLDHIAAGMETTYTVLDKGIKAPTNGSSPNIHIG
ncbi:hephaestin-like protein 1 [Plakobranchus ocellatus]|uniref:Hephaestin-like protein 1 n=1 Tax=Plakobranchus ocellatus TaxID=259542 RepID=A0AAV3Y8M7_9GAST|nr:hephaestin-like protein 1 [Plakobranchus ocellatus]